MSNNNDEYDFDMRPDPKYVQPKEEFNMAPNPENVPPANEFEFNMRPNPRYVQPKEEFNMAPNPENVPPADEFEFNMRPAGSSSNSSGDINSGLNLTPEETYRQQSERLEQEQSEYYSERITHSR